MASQEMKFQRATILLAPIGAICLLASVSWAASEPAARPTSEAGLFHRLDANNDGVVGPGETPEEHRRLFERLLRTSDRNGDGLLSAAELSDGLQPSTADKPMDAPTSAELPGAEYARLLLLRLDTDRDSTLTRDEAPPALQDVFDRIVDRIDRNNDAVISRMELNRAGPQLIGASRRAAREMRWDVDAELAKLQRQQGEAIYRFDNPINPREALTDPKQAKQLFDQLDSNGDRKLTLDEVPEQIRDRFSRFFSRSDTNRDKVLTRDEYLAGAERAARFLRFAGSGEASSRSKSPAAESEVMMSPDTPAATRESSQPETVASRLVRKMVKRSDRNGDGLITRGEAKGSLAKNFDEADLNSDGQLDAQELAAATERLDKRLRATAKK